jgi:hypothetical protein
MKNYKNKLQNSSLLNVMRNFDQSNTLPEFDLELFIHCGVELARIFHQNGEDAKRNMHI